MREIDEIKKQKILEHVNASDYKNMTVKQFAVIFGVQKEDIKYLENIVSRLESEGYIYIDDSKRICKPDNDSKFVCKYEAKSKGFGFARIISVTGNDKLDSVKDIYISKENSMSAFDLDIVLVAPIKSTTTNKNLEGKIIKIIKRADKNVVGIFKNNNTFGFVESLIPGIEDIYIPYKGMQGVQNNDRVIVNITKYPASGRKAEGKVIEVIGSENEEDIESKVIFSAHGIEEKFPNEVLNEAEDVSKILAEDIKDRVDLRKERIYTIDGDDAKDLDDAISVVKQSEDEYKVSVHIADVSHYVKAGSSLDLEAIKRGTSIYTPGKVVPMLPRTLSNGICSLTEGEDRLALSIDIVIDTSGKILFSTIYKSVICSNKRMTYDKVEKVINKSDKEVLKEYGEYIKDIDLMCEVFDILKAAREKSGSMDFDIPESKFTLDDNGDVIDVKPYKVGKSNMIIEEFMLLANKTIAKTFCELSAPFIYRIHEAPDIEKLRELNEVLQNMGTSIKGINKIHTRALADVLNVFKDDNSKYMIISKLLLRSLKLAKYSDRCLGHFGLNFTYYCHFTSPIRRYPDLFIHRVISKYIETGYNPDSNEISKLYKKANAYSYSSSECEKTATDIERQFDDLYKAKYMKKHLGDVFTGVISSVTNFGIYVKLPNTVEGLVTMSNLKDDYYIYNEKAMQLTGERTGKKYSVGETIEVVVARADEVSRQIDFTINGGK